MMTNEYDLNIARLRFAARLRRRGWRWRSPAPVARSARCAGRHRVPSGGSDRGGDAGRHAMSGPDAMGGHHVT
jgi:hypothetical protein